MAGHISFRDVNFHSSTTGVRIIVITDVPSHLYCRLTLEEPHIHKKPSYRRGLWLADDVRFCFNIFEDNEQSEPGDTLTHTFWKTDWPVCTIKYCYFWGMVAAEPCPSTSALFSYHNDGVDPVSMPEHTTRNITCVEPQWFTTTAAFTWEDFDLSKVVPDGATGAVFQVINRDASASRPIGLRKKGSTQSYGGDIGIYNHIWAMVGLDENRKCQALAGRVGYIDFLLFGYTGENYTFFTDGYNIVPAAKKSWVDTDLSTLCPGGIAAIIEFATYLDKNDFVGARKHGSTDDRHRGSGHTWMVVGLDANGHLDLYDEDWPHWVYAFNLMGYITAGATFYTNADDISVAGDGAWHNRSLLSHLANPVMAFIELDSGAGWVKWALRKNIYCGDIYWRGGNKNFAIIHPNTPNALINVKLEDPTAHIYLQGIA